MGTRYLYWIPTGPSFAVYFVFLLSLWQVKTLNNLIESDDERSGAISAKTTSACGLL